MKEILKQIKTIPVLLSLQGLITGVLIVLGPALSMGATCWTGEPPQALPPKNTHIMKIKTEMRLNKLRSTVVPFLYAWVFKI